MSAELSLIDEEPESLSRDVSVSGYAFDQLLEQEKKLALLEDRESAVIFVSVNFLEFYFYGNRSKKIGQSMVGNLINHLPDFFPGKLQVVQLDQGEIGIIARDMTQKFAGECAERLRRATWDGLLASPEVPISCVVHCVPERTLDTNRGLHLLKYLSRDKKGKVLEV